MSISNRIRSWFNGADKKKSKTDSQAPSDEQLIERARHLLKELKSRLAEEVSSGEYEKALGSARKIIQLGWWSIANVRFDTELDSSIHEIGTALCVKDIEIDPSRILYVTSGILTYGGLTQLLVNQLEYHDRERFDIHVYSTEQFSNSNLDCDRAKRVRELSSFQIAQDPQDYLGSAQELAAYVKKERIGRIVLLCSPDDVVGLVLPSMLPQVPSVFVNGSHHVFTGGSFQFDAFVDITEHYHLETVNSGRNQNPHYITLCGRLDLDKADRMEARDFRKELNLGTETLLSITVGNINKNTWAGDDSYLHVIGSALTEHDHYHHLLLANGAEKLVSAIVKEYPAAEGKLHAISPTPDIISALKGCDLYLNSFPMGGALSTLDAMTAGLPIVFISAHEAWFKKPALTVHDREGYSLLLNRYIIDEKFRNRSRIEIESLYRAELSPERVVKRYEELFSSLIVQDMSVPEKRSVLELERPRVSGFANRLSKMEKAD